jgi:5-methylcytosine-specific restriction endonuclease McrA
VSSLRRGRQGRSTRWIPSLRRFHAPHSNRTEPLRRERLQRGNWRQYTGALLRPDEGSLDHVLPRSRGGKDEWGNLVWSDKAVNAKKGNRLPHEAGLKLLTVPRAPKQLPVTTLIRNAHGIVDWKLFVKE